MYACVLSEIEAVRGMCRIVAHAGRSCHFWVYAGNYSLLEACDDPSSNVCLFQRLYNVRCLGLGCSPLWDGTELSEITFFLFFRGLPLFSVIA
jgi:hypothetical protein